MKIDEQEIAAYIRKFLSTPLEGPLPPTMAYRSTARVRDLNPEQKLCYALQKLVENKSDALVLMRLCLVLAEDVKEWRAKQSQQEPRSET